MKIILLEKPNDPLVTIAHGIEVMTGKYISLDELRETVLDVRKTNLQGVLETIHFSLSIKGVTRAFTHQLVRYRTASFNQESMRFVRPEGKDWYYVPERLKLPGNGELLAEYCKQMEFIKESYNFLIEKGAPIEVARGLLPTNVLTNIDMACNFRTLVNICETRLCNQAQKGEWGEFANQVKGLVKEQVRDGDVLAEFLQPICERTKRCEYGSLFDRPCPRQELWKRGS